MKKILSLGCVFCMLLLSGCTQAKQTEDVKIGVSISVGEASRWASEVEYMKEEAEELGIQIEARLNKAGISKPQIEDCKEMIDGGIDVLILSAKDAKPVSEILDYAKAHNVKVVSYARVVLGESVDLFVGYDTNRIGQMMGQYLAEMVYEGNYIILRGDENDSNANLLYQGAMRYIDEIKDDIQIILDAPVAKWSVDEAKALVSQALLEHQNQVDAIFAPNDNIADGCIQVLEELGITTPVVITGMDAELTAAKHIVDGKQSMTVYMDLKELAKTAIIESYHLAMGEKVNTNAEFENQSEAPIAASLINGKIVTNKNLDAVLINSGYYTKEEVYGE